MFDCDALSFAMIRQNTRCAGDLMLDAFVYGGVRPGLGATSRVDGARGDEA
jgi:hypothetical protein